MKSIVDLQFQGSFRTTSIEENLIYGFILLQDYENLEDFYLDTILVSKKFVEFNNSGEKLLSITFTIKPSIENELIFFLFDSLIKSHSNGVSNDEINNIVKILKSFINKKSNDYLGLLGECLFIYWLVMNSKESEILWWHNSLNENFDFTSGSIIYEVKTTNNNSRKHLIKYNQHKDLINDYRSLKYYISVLIIDIEADTDLKSLIYIIKTRLSGNVLNYFNEIIQKYKKEIWEIPLKFNLNESLNSIKMINVMDIGDIHINNEYIDFESLSIPIKFDFIK